MSETAEAIDELQAEIDRLREENAALKVKLQEVSRVVVHLYQGWDGWEMAEIEEARRCIEVGALK